MNIFTELQIEELVSNFGKEHIKKQISDRVVILMNELISKTKLYSADEAYPKQETDNAHPFIKAFTGFFDSLRNR